LMALTVAICHSREGFIILIAPVSLFLPGIAAIVVAE